MPPDAVVPDGQVRFAVVVGLEAVHATLGRDPVDAAGGKCASRSRPARPVAARVVEAPLLRLADVGVDRRARVRLQLPPERIDRPHQHAVRRRRAFGVEIGIGGRPQPVRLTPVDAVHDRARSARQRIARGVRGLVDAWPCGHRRRRRRAGRARRRGGSRRRAHDVCRSLTPVHAASHKAQTPAMTVRPRGSCMLRSLRRSYVSSGRIAQSPCATAQLGCALSEVTSAGGSGHT